MYGSFYSIKNRINSETMINMLQMISNFMSRTLYNNLSTPPPPPPLPSISIDRQSTTIYYHLLPSTTIYYHPTTNPMTTNTCHMTNKNRPHELWQLLIKQIIVPSTNTKTFFWRPSKRLSQWIFVLKLRKKYYQPTNDLKIQWDKQSQKMSEFAYLLLSFFGGLLGMFLCLLAVNLNRPIWIKS